MMALPDFSHGSGIIPLFFKKNGDAKDTQLLIAHGYISKYPSCKNQEKPPERSIGFSASPPVRPFCVIINKRL
jgi:hypothetical protein